MTRYSNILDREEFRRRESQAVPEGYFESLQARLERISTEQSAQSGVKPAAVKVRRPVLYWAAGIAAALITGLLMLNRGASSVSGVSVTDSYELMAEAGMASMTDLDASLLAAGIEESEIPARADGDSSEVDLLFESYSQDEIARYLSENGILY